MRRTVPKAAVCWGGAWASSPASLRRRISATIHCIIPGVARWLVGGVAVQTPVGADNAVTSRDLRTRGGARGDESISGRGDRGEPRANAICRSAPIGRRAARVHRPRPSSPADDISTTPSVNTLMTSRVAPVHCYSRPYEPGMHVPAHHGPGKPLRIPLPTALYTVGANDHVIELGRREGSTDVRVSAVAQVLVGPGRSIIGCGEKNGCSTPSPRPQAAWPRAVAAPAICRGHLRISATLCPSWPGVDVRQDCSRLSG